MDDPSLDYEYLPITGLPEFVSGSATLILGKNSIAIREQRVARCVDPSCFTSSDHM